MSEIFTSELLCDGIYVIRGEGCDSYLLPGGCDGGEAIMIDSGMSPHDIRAFAERAYGIKVRRVVNTHSHFDHTAGNGFFDIVYATEGIAHGAKTTMGADPALFRLDYACTIIKDGDTIDIGDRPLQIIELDCHSPGNIAILDINRRALFPGDEIDTGQVLLLPGYAEKPGQYYSKPAASVETYLRALIKLQNLRERYDRVFPAHNGAPVDTGWIDRYCVLARRILDGYKGSEDCTGRGYDVSMSHFPLKHANYRRAEWDGASLVYCADLLWDADYAKWQALQAANPMPVTELHRIVGDGVINKS